MKRLIIISSFLFLYGCINPSKETKSETKKLPYVVMLSMDAFRWDYPDLYDTPNLDSIARIGVKSKSLQPCFPSKTFPNHYSMATGMHPDHHGIVQNNFYDSLLGEFRMSDINAVSNPSFYGGEPIWVTAEKQGVKSACFFWPGSEAPIKGIYPSIWKEYDEDISFDERIDSVISWLQLPYENRPHLVFWYMHEPDETSHKFGPYSEQTKAEVEYLDSLVGVFCKKLYKLSIADSVNIIFTSDHGMGEISHEKTINLSNHININWIEDVKGSNPVFFIKPKPEFIDSVLLHLNNIHGMMCRRKGNLPEKFLFGSNKRIYEIVCVADSSFSIEWKYKSYSKGGAHGYDPYNTDMHAIFYAVGPDFKKKFRHPPFLNIHIFPLLAEILSLKSPEIDGDINEVNKMLFNKE